MTDSSNRFPPKTETLDESGPYLDELPDDALYDTLLNSQAKAITALAKASSQLRSAIQAASMSDVSAGGTDLRI